ncbi:MAM and LDL-receptor class A domain-containing protein 2 [Trichonephila clavata]|uniref:MAM and LDL-receptor class A domain-containing protein 2 n=1 Tax=Trichonephila clavata TaxID=2740835 RepID=A0A8X6KIB7_TRICU|nr:MAM and LDL-receptor class A domain-containing protein 2 [Trichonephila clavata]
MSIEEQQICFVLFYTKKEFYIAWSKQCIEALTLRDHNSKSSGGISCLFSRIVPTTGKFIGTFRTTWLITKVQNTTISEWRYAEANVDITEDYQFQFTAFIESSKEVVVAIDDVKLIPGRCPETGFCDFEEDICSWKYGEGQYKWDRIRASSKGIQKIGPNFDNTLGTNNGKKVNLDKLAFLVVDVKE